MGLEGKRAHDKIPCLVSNKSCSLLEKCMFNILLLGSPFASYVARSVTKQSLLAKSIRATILIA